MKLFRNLKVLLMLGVVIGLVVGTPGVTNAAGETLLHKGMNQSDVKPLQRQLKNFDYYHFHIDGLFGSLTDQGVKEFQKDHVLRVDGIVGPHTRKALKKAKSLANQFHNAPIIKQGSHGKIVKTVQTQLQHLDYYHSNLDGIYGPLTEKAVSAFQRSNHITVDGITGPNTYSALIHNPVHGGKKNKVSKPSTQRTSKASTDSSKKTTTQAKQKTRNQKDKTASKANSASVDQNSQPKSVRTLSVTSTAYTAHCNGCSGITATGINLLKYPGRKVVAVDPNVIPLGSKVWVEGYGTAVAGDTGGAIKGNRIDVFIPDRAKASQWGRKPVKIKILE